MRVALIGGIWSGSGALRQVMVNAPETVLSDGLEEAGCHVTRVGIDATHLPRDIDVVHAHHFGRATFSAALHGESPLVLTPHNPFIASRFPERLSAAQRFLRSATISRATRVVALSNAEASAFRERFTLADHRIAVISNALSKGFLSVETGARSVRREGLVLNVAQLEPFKGHRVLLEAVRALVPHVPSIHVVVATTNRVGEASVRAYARTLGIEDRLEIVGPWTGDQLRMAYLQCSVYVQASLAEAASNSTMEALALGAPVVATNVGGTAELVQDGARLVRPGSSSDLAQALADVLSNARTRAELAIAAKRQVSRFDQARLIEQHLRMYADVVREGPVGPSLAVHAARIPWTLWLSLKATRR